MRLFTTAHINRALAKFPDAAEELRAWVGITREAQWRNFVDLRATVQSADAVDEFVVFNIRHNRYRLICVIHYCLERNGKLSAGHVYVKSFLTHKQYNTRSNWTKGVK